MVPGYAQGLVQGLARSKEPSICTPITSPVHSQEDTALPTCSATSLASTLTPGPFFTSTPLPKPSSRTPRPSLAQMLSMPPRISVLHY